MAVEELLKKKTTELETLKNNVKTLREQIEAQGEKAVADDRTKLNTMVDEGMKLRGEVTQLEQELELTAERKVDQAVSSVMARNGGLWMPRKSWGQVLVEAPEFKNRPSGAELPRVKVGQLPIGRKDLYEGTDATGGAAVPVQFIPEMVDVARMRPLTILDLVNRSRTTVDAVEFYEKSSRTNAAAVKAEYSGGSYPSAAESNITFAKRTANVKTIATYVEASMQLLDDAPRMEDTVNQDLRYMVEVTLENQVLAGGGTGEDFTGLNAWSGIQTRTHLTGARAESTDTVVDTIRRAITDVILELYTPDGIIMNPADGEKMELTKDDNGQYSKIYDPVGNRIWRVPVLETVAQTAGTATIGAFKLACTLWDRLDTQIRAGQPGDLFLQLAFAIIAYLRAAFAVTRPKAICKVDGI